MQTTVVVGLHSSTIGGPISVADLVDLGSGDRIGRLGPVGLPPESVRAIATDGTDYWVLGIGVPGPTWIARVSRDGAVRAVRENVGTGFVVLDGRIAVRAPAES